MSWNYRIMKHDSDADPWYGLHEVYYGDDGRITRWSAEPARFSSETASGIHESLLRARVDARKRPILLESQAMLAAGGRDGQATPVP